MIDLADGLVDKTRIHRNAPSFCLKDTTARPANFMNTEDLPGRLAVIVQNGRKKQ